MHGAIQTDGGRAMHIFCCVLSAVLGVYPDTHVPDSPVEFAPRRAALPLPASAAIPEEVPTSRDKLPPRAEAHPRRDWILSVEGATHAPIDMGVLASLETPTRLRLSFGYGWVPSVYSGLLTGIAASASGDAQVGAILNHTSYQGRTFRGQAGVRPFRSLGLYADLGYARLNVDGALDLAESGVPSLQVLVGGYQAHTTVDMWLVEIGSQHEFWDSVVMGLAFGVMGTFEARTSITSENGAPTSPALGQAAKQTDAALKSYGFVPTITLRLGFDFFSLTPGLLAQSRPSGWWQNPVGPD
jgi:hypothetical protein